MAQISRKLLTLKNVLTWIPNSSRFRATLKSERVHESKTLVKSARDNFYPNFLLFQDKLSWKISFRIRCKMLRLFVKTLRADAMYSRASWEKFLQRLQTQLSWEPKTSSRSFFSIFEILVKSCRDRKKKDQLGSSNILEVIHFEKCAYLNAKKDLISEDFLGVKVFTGRKQCSNLRGIAFILIFH